jgi:hypothetical protein
MASAVLLAEDISFEASVDSDKVVKGAALQLTLQVRGTQDLDQIILPAIDGFEARFIGSSTQVQVINGEYSASKAFTYMLIPQKEGKFTIPPVEIKVKGKSYTSQAVNVEVVPPSAVPGQAELPANVINDPQALAERVHMFVMIPEGDRFIREEVPLIIKLYVRDLPMEDISLPRIDPQGFSVSEFSRPKQYQEAFQGKTFDVVEFAARLTPSRDGALTVGPAVITGNLIIKDNVRHNPFSGSGFNEDFFAGFFNSYQKKAFTIRANPVVMNVKPLPSEGCPADFSGGVGQFNFEASVAPLKVKAGDPVTVKMLVSGTGDLKAVKMPEVKDGLFKKYDPKVRESGGQKILEQVIIPAKEGAAEVPALTFGYFDTRSGTYVNIVRGPFPLQVLPMDQGQSFQAVGFSDRQGVLVKENIGSDIVFIKDRPGRLFRKEGRVGHNALLITIIVVYLNIWGVLYGVYLYRRRLESDPGLAHRSSALRTARAAMKALQPLIESGDFKDFYSSLFKVFHEYLEKRLNIPPGKADLSSMETVLMAKKIDTRHRQLLADIYDFADRARFASIAVGREDMKRSLLDMEEVIDAIERRVK